MLNRSNISSKQVLRHRLKGCRMVVIVDNARWHPAKVLHGWLAEHRDVLRLDFLPPYSPELNPVERVWKLTSTLCTHNRYFEDLEALINTVKMQFNAWIKPNDVLHRLCTIN